ncbi:hypothetical protein CAUPRSCDRAFT_13022, partial [Caulochytrium protostelioides]
MFSLLRDPKVPFYEFQQCVSTMTLPQKKLAVFESLLHASLLNRPPEAEIELGQLERWVQQELPISMREGFQPLFERYRAGLSGHEFSVVQAILEDYRQIASDFAGPFETAYSALRERYQGSPSLLRDRLRIRAAHEQRQVLVKILLDFLHSDLDFCPYRTQLMPVMQALSSLDEQTHRKVVTRARELVRTLRQPPH